ncbi:Hypothetical predicted protein [Podarcis lilfordi]|uniref:Uncharacterized protein n=1 Tax=Podarcis lilfordi TaxID=74358 RepID=A0AA35K3H8_9SAUR|nr:Hypothetical predicted protein [Podarcis lilfordi]
MPVPDRCLIIKNYHHLPWVVTISSLLLFFIFEKERFFRIASLHCSLYLSKSCFRNSIPKGIEELEAVWPGLPHEKVTVKNDSRQTKTDLASLNMGKVVHVVQAVSHMSVRP